MELRPSEIRYSQDSIARNFGRSTGHPLRPIGQTLDDILSGRCNVNSIPRISVVYRHGHWFTVDNRRLWVFQKAEERGKCDKILVYETSFIDDEKFTTTNEGRSVQVRGDPGGNLWRPRRYPINKERRTPRTYSVGAQHMVKKVQFVLADPPVSILLQGCRLLIFPGKITITRITIDPIQPL